MTGLPSLTINVRQILIAVRGAKRLTSSGGLQQITPWLLKRTIVSYTNQECAIIAGRVATRWGRGDFDSCLSELVAESHLIALYKDAEKIHVRPVSFGYALRRLLTKRTAPALRIK